MNDYLYVTTILLLTFFVLSWLLLLATRRRQKIVESLVIVLLLTGYPIVLTTVISVLKNWEKWLILDLKSKNERIIKGSEVLLETLNRLFNTNLKEICIRERVSSDCNGTRIYNQLIGKQTVNHLVQTI